MPRISYGAISGNKRLTDYSDTKSAVISNSVRLGTIPLKKKREDDTTQEVLTYGAARDP